MIIKELRPIWVLCLLIVNVQLGITQVADGDLSIRLIGAPNLAVDSNDPSTGPRSAYVGVEVCNLGSDDLTNLIIQVGDFANDTPGEYPLRTVVESNYSGTFSFEHANDCDELDAYREMDVLMAGECFTQYWLIEYPLVDDSGNSVAGANTIDDDLYLEWDVWASADDNGTALAVNDTYRSYMRSMLSASANKAWPNGTGKVPEEYLQIFEDSLGWRPDTTNQIAGCLFTLEGIWYDLGNINKGFDNDGDLVPDYNVFLQPVGNASTFDNCCFRLLKVYGVLIIKLTGGGEKIIAFEDDFYHTDMPQNNNGGVGLVYYEYVPLSAPCTGLITPYQNVASGNNNEKYSGDFGVTLGGPTSEVPLASLDKSGPTSSNYDTDIDFSITVNNTTNKALGIIEYYEALTIIDSIPSGSTYVAGSAETNNILPSGITITAYYSTDSGITYSTVEPLASSVTHVKWEFNENLPATESAILTLTLQAPFATFTDPLLINEARLQFGEGDPIFYALDTVILLGTNQLGGTIFEDDGGTNGILGNGIQDGDEIGISNISVSLFFDINSNGVYDQSDYLLDTQDSDVNGNYTFTNLPDGLFFVIVSESDTNIPLGSGLSTSDYILTVTLSSGDDLTNDFGFTPALKIAKSVSSSPLYYEGREVTFDLTVQNLISSLVASNDTATVLDRFNSYSYSNNDGTESWSGDWVESENDGPNSGSININNPAQRLVISSGSIYRDVDLTGANTAFLSFIHRTQSGTGTVTVEISDDNGSSWNVVEVFSMSVSESSGVSVSYDISSFISNTGDTRLRFSHSGGTGIKSIDDVEIEYYFSSESAGDCNVHDLYIAYDDRGQFIPQANLFGAPDDNFASAFWGNIVEGGVFTLPADTSYSIIKVEVAAQVYHTGSIINDQWNFRLNIDGSAVGSTYSTTIPQTQALQGLSNAGEISFDISSEQSSWAWSNFTDQANTGYGIWFQAFQVSADDGATPFIDAVWFRITTDEVCANTGNNNTVYNANSTIDPLPLIDMYDADSLSFVSADIYPDSIDAVNGKLYWDNIGPLNAGDVRSIEVTFEALEPPSNSTGTASNMGIVNNALFGNGSLANNDTATAQITIQPAGSISGYVWSDANGNGWAGTTGYASPEQFIPNITMTLFSCTNVANNGSCNGTLSSTTTTTDDNGFYIFDGLETGLHYYVELDESTLPGTSINQTGDPDDDPNRGSGNGGTCGTGGANARCDASWDNDGDWFELGVDFWGTESWDITEINFGYEINPLAFGSVWEDVNNNGIRELSEPGISGVTIEFVTPSCTVGSTCPTEVTDSNGDYTFENLSAANNNIMTVVSATLPSGNTWTQTFESDGTINNDIDIDIGNGDISGSHDFGFHAIGTGQVGNLVYYDNDGSGNHDAGEEGIIGVTLYLYRNLNDNQILDNGIDLLIDSIFTDGSGFYSFTNLPIGEYIVAVQDSRNTFPNNVIRSGDPDEDGVCLICDGIAYTSLNSSIDNSLDFGYLPIGEARIGDLVWRDLNGDQQVSNILESGLGNILIELEVDFNQDGIFVPYRFSQSIADGSYQFTDLPDGTYLVEVNDADIDLPMDIYNVSMVPTTSTIDTIVISAGEVININGNGCVNCELDIDFGFAFPGAIGNQIFYDNNGNATQDFGELGISGVTLYLCYDDEVLCNSSSAIETVVSDSDGLYVFTGLLEDVYKVAIDESTLPSGITGASQTSDPDRDGVACDDNTYPSLPSCDNEAIDLEIYYGTRLLGIDFSYQPVGVVGDLVWLDLDGNGIQNNDEPGLAEVIVSIDPPTGVNLGAGDGIAISTTTDLDGFYSFASLPDATYTLSVAAPSGYTSVYEVDGTLNNEVVVTISGGIVSDGSNSWCSDLEGCDLDLDFGYGLNGIFDIGGTVCIDDSGEDGICSTGGESLQGGAQIFLYNDEGLLLGSTSTSIDGSYLFTGLPSDIYNIALSTNVEPFNLLTLTTTASDTPASTITDNGTSVIQSVTISSSSISGLDFAFVFEGSIDFGDLPSPYSTLLSDSPSGPYHVISGLPTLYLGAYVDTEDIPVQNSLSTGDDITGIQDDEDGITPLNTRLWTNGIDGGQIQVDVVGDGWLVGYMDFDNDNSFSDAGEMIINQSITAGTSILTFDIPAGANVDNNNQFYSRFRIFESAPLVPELAFTGFSISGEVEDYLINVIKSRKITTNLFIPPKLRNKE